MLFDLQARGRRRTVQVIYALLAVLMAGGLVFFGIGGSVSGGLFDAIKGDGTTSGSDTFDKRAASLEKRVAASPRSQKLLAELTRARYQAATADVDQATGQFSDDGVAKLKAAARSWERYLALDPKQPDDQVASMMVQALGTSGLNRPADAVTAMEIVVDARPSSSGLYTQLALLAYAAGQTRKGDLARGKALELAPKDQRATVKSTIDTAKSQAAEAASTTTTP